MKRSNRLILLIGIFLAIVAFIGIVLIFQNNNNTGGTGSTAAPTQLPTVYAKADIPFGTVVTQDMVELRTIPVDQRATDAFGDTGLVIGKAATTNIVAGKQLESSDFALSRTGQAPVAPNIAPGFEAIAVLVDQTSGVGTLINVGDHVDVIGAFDKSNWINPQGVPVPNPPVPAPETGGNASSVKILAQGLTVVGTLLPPPAAPAQGAQPSPSAGPETALNGQQEIVILQGTAQQAEIVRFAQLDGTIALALRSPKDFVGPDGKPVVPPVVKTTGIVLKTLIDQYGVLPPELEQVTVKGQR